MECCINGEFYTTIGVASALVRRLLAIGFLLAFVAAAVAYSKIPGSREAGVFDVSLPTPYFHYTAGGTPRSRLLVIHGLGGNKDMLNPLCYGLADAGIEVFSIDLPGHGSSTEAFNAVQATEVVRQIFHRLGKDTDVLGHSLGGALALEVAQDEAIRNLILFSPAPIPMEGIRSSHILLFYGEEDLGPILAFTPELREIAGDAMEFHEVAGAGHTSAPGNPKIIEQVAKWLGGETRAIQTSKRQNLLLTMLASSVALGITLLQSLSKQSITREYLKLHTRTLVAYVGAAAAAAGLLAFVPLTQWLGLMASDKLLGFMAVTGAILCAIYVRIDIKHRPLLIGVGAAAYVIAVPLLLVISEYMQLRLPGPRLLRFAAMTALALPLFLADEVLIRPIRPRWKGLFAMLVTRGLLGAIVFSAAVRWWDGTLFLGMMMDSVVYFWIGLWFVGSVVHWRTKDPLATAVFMALIQGWLFAALFVIA
jgi:hypothetical protein